MCVIHVQVFCVKISTVIDYILQISRTHEDCTNVLESCVHVCACAHTLVHACACLRVYVCVLLSVV